jgi:hypothetical protein
VAGPFSADGLLRPAPLSSSACFILSPLTPYSPFAITHRLPESVRATGPPSGHRIGRPLLRRSSLGCFPSIEAIFLWRRPGPVQEESSPGRGWLFGTPGGVESWTGSGRRYAMSLRGKAAITPTPQTVPLENLAGSKGV